MERRSDPALQPRHGDSLGAIKETALTGIRCSMHIYVYTICTETHITSIARNQQRLYSSAKRYQLRLIVGC